MPNVPTRPQGLGITFSPAHATGSPYGNAGSLMAHANDIIARTPNKLGQTFAGIAQGLKGLGSGLKDAREEQNQAGLQRVLQGGDYNAPSVWDKITATMGHAADGSLGQHANDRTAIRPTPMDRNPGNIVIGENGRLRYDPNAGSRAALDAEKLKQAQIDSARMKREEEQASVGRRAPMRGKDGQPTTGGNAGDGKEPLPTDKGPNPKDETPLIPGSKALYPGSVMTTADAGQIPVPQAPVVPGPVNPQTMTATAGSPLSEGATATAGPGDFNYAKAATDPRSLNAAVTPGGDFNYSGSPLSASSMMGPGDVYNAYDQTGGFNDSGGLASSFGPAPFQFSDPNTSTYDSSQGLYAGSDYGSGSPLADIPATDVPPPVDIPVGDGGGMYG